MVLNNKMEPHLLEKIILDSIFLDRWELHQEMRGVWKGTFCENICRGKSHLCACYCDKGECGSQWVDLCTYLWDETNPYNDITHNIYKQEQDQESIQKLMKRTGKNYDIVIKALMKRGGDVINALMDLNY
jgi:hypothetical protein